MSVAAMESEQVGHPERAPLSLAQEFLSVFDKGPAEGAFADRHTLVYGWRVRGRIQVETLRAALADVVARHEALRTSIVRTDGDPHQHIHPAGPAPLLVQDLSGTAPEDRDLRAEQFVNGVDAAPFPVTEIPHVRVLLGRFDDEDAVLVVATHHIATDAWSLGLVLRDLAACYAARTGAAGRLPAAAQYREMVAWQRTSLRAPRIEAARAYWRETLRGAGITTLPLDRPRTAGVPNSYALRRFVLDAELGAAVQAFARSARCSPFIVLMAAYTLLVHRATGARDVVVPTFTSGRDDERFADTVGPFFNFVPLRTRLEGCTSFRDVAARTRTTCLGAYTNDIPFPVIAAEAPELMAPSASDRVAVVAFELLQSPSTMDGDVIGGLRYTEIRRRTLSQEICSHIPDGGLWALDVLPSGEIAGSLKYDSNLFDASTIAGLVTGFEDVLRTSLGAPDSPLPPT